MSTFSFGKLCLAAALCGALVAARSAPGPGGSAQVAQAVVTHEPIKPIPAPPALPAAKVELGRRLFNDPVLSRDNSTSCASCHDLQKGGADGRKHSVGALQKEGRINAPTIFNVSLNFRQFWDGRAATLEEQVDSPLEASEMATTWPEVIGRLRTQDSYVKAFAVLYPDGIQAKNVRDAIAEFERSLTTPDCRFDQYLRGDEAALTDEEKEGYRKFKAYGCTSCHQGVNVGGNMFETFGAMRDYFGQRGQVTREDFGRFNVTGREEDRFVFKVPGLRNVALTAPYFHDGSAETLEQAVVVMGKVQLGRELPAKDVAVLVKFLKTLTGQYGGKPL